jgi:S-DNA-T family DNA segregation ATPase FtsK/SpoIIIE
MAPTAARNAASALRLPLTIEYGDEAVDVAVEAQLDATGATVIVAVTSAVHASTDAVVECARTRRAIEPLTSIESAGLMRGDRLIVGGRIESQASKTGAAWDLVVLGGPAAGTRFPLVNGEQTLGRDGTLAIDDPSLSGVHVALTVRNGGVVVRDAGSRNGTAIEGIALAPDEERAVAEGAVIRAGRTTFTIEKPAAAAAPDVPLADGSIPFNRPPRVVPPFTPARFALEPPPGPAQRPRIPLAACLMPVLIGVVLYFVLHNVAMLAFVAFSPLMAVGTFVEDRRNGKGHFKRESARFRERLAKLRTDLDSARATEAIARRASAPPLADLIERAETRSERLWERRPADEDFLALRLGSASLPSTITVDFPDGGVEAMRAEADELLAWYGVVPEVPVVGRLKELGVLGLAGPRERVDALGRALVVQMAALHSASDMTIMAALSEDAVAGWDWVKWLPHFQSDDECTAAVGTEAANELIDELLRTERERSDRTRQAVGDVEQLTTIVLLADERVLENRAVLGPLLRRGRESRIYVVWLGADRRALPGECEGVVELDSQNSRLTFTRTTSADVVTDVTADGVEPRLARRVAVALAPFVDVSASAAATRIPPRIALLDLLDVDELDPEWVTRRWERSSGLGAEIGATGDGALTIDFRREGPHGLVAGTTGAGKSELLQTLVASLALAHPPSRLTFLLVDYKGGAAFKDCDRLPHAVGMVTDLDEHLTQRALVSLEAELRRREAILRDAGARDLQELEQRSPDRAPPSLLIVIDEFATLAKDVPEFVQGVVDVAQRGRSLGVHLLLATQSPSGVVTKDIRANTNLKIALRVSGPGESQDVLEVADAAAIPRSRPGRAIARTGHGELTMFQSAFVGGVTASQQMDVAVRRFELAGSNEQPTVIAEAASATPETDLDRIVEVCREAVGLLDLASPRKPWLDALPASLPLRTLEQPADPAEAAVGLIDDPEHQSQYPFILDLAETGSVLVYGAGGSGKSSLLRSLATSLARRSRVSNFHVYGLDFAGHGLRPLEALPHCGAVIAGGDIERVERLFTVLRRRIDSRKEALAEHRVFSIEELAQVSGQDVPRTLVLLDGYSNFLATFERVTMASPIDALPRLMSDGRAVGVHFVLTADRRGAFSSTIASAAPEKIIFRMAAEDDYLTLGLDLRRVRGAKLPPGRAFTSTGLEAHAATVSDDPAPEAQTAAIEALGASLADADVGHRAPAIGQLPTVVGLGEMPVPDRPLTAALGIADQSLEPLVLDLAERHFLVVGPRRSGRSTALATIALGLRQGSSNAEFFLAAPRRSPLTNLPLWMSKANGPDACAELIRELDAALSASVENGVPRFLVIDDGEELLDSPASATLEGLIRRGRDRHLYVLAALERTAARAFSGWPRELRKDEMGLLLRPDDDDGLLLGAALPRRRNMEFPAGRGYFVAAGTVELVQVANS